LTFAAPRPAAFEAIGLLTASTCSAFRTIHFSWQEVSLLNQPECWALAASLAAMPFADPRGQLASVEVVDEPLPCCHVHSAVVTVDRTPTAILSHPSAPVKSLFMSWRPNRR
jgi:hypothetical protein